MSYLFIDSTYDLSLGVLGDDLKWLSFETKKGVKASAVIQAASYELLNRHQIRPENLKGIITVNGPGFYTGLRLAEGFANVFKFFGVPELSFYTYEIPKWCGFLEGAWFTKAYKGEYFFYLWSAEKAEQMLVSAKDLAFNDRKYFIHSEVALDTLSGPHLVNAISTLELLKSHPEKIFSNVVTGLQREPFYFRAPEDEFKANP